MRKVFFLAGLVLLLAAFSACATESKSSPVEGTLTIPNGFGYGGINDGIVITFLRVEDDSRCAADVQCVRAGEAFVVLSTTVGGGAPVESRSEMVSGTPTVLNIDRFTLTLLELRPDPPPVGGVGQDQYELLLRIEEN